MTNSNNFWLKLKRPFSILAPMEDVTDLCFRKLIASLYRPDVFFTEFTSTDGLFSRGRERILPRLQFENTEHPIVAQIWGNKPELYVKAGKLLSTMNFDGIDINMGCPVTKVVRRGECSGLIDNPTLAAEIIAALRESSNGLPISVKTRLGNKQRKTDTWFSFLLSQNLDALTVHGRIAKDLSKVPADWCEIAKVVKMRNEISPKTLIIGNGDIMSQEDFEARQAETDVDGIMVGRGIFHNYFIFDPSKRKFADLDPPSKMKLLLKHFDLYESCAQSANSNPNTKRPYNSLKKFFKIYASGFPDASDLRDKLVRTENIVEARTLVHSFLDNPQIDLSTNDDSEIVSQNP